MKFLLVFVMLLVSITTFAPADSVRGPLIGYATTESSVAFSAGDLVALDLGDSPELYAAYRIHIRIPEAIRNMRGAYAMYIYRDISPKPTPETMRYNGSRVDFFLVPPISPFSVTLPLVDSYRQENTIDAITIDRTFGQEDFPVVFAILPVMKGIPSSSKDEVFTADLRPLYKEKGVLVLAYPHDKNSYLPFELLINDEPVSTSSNMHVLAPGFYTISLKSDHYADKRYNIAIEKGLYATVTIPFEPITPTITVVAPEAATVFLDGSLLDAMSRTDIGIESGEHSVHIRLGDYSLSRTFVVEPGESYTVELEMEISITPRNNDGNGTD